MEEKTRLNLSEWARPQYALIALAIIIFGAIVIVSILRERIVDKPQNQVSITGQGKVSYQPDIADVTLGVQIDKAATSQDAINQLNERMTKITAALEQLGIAKEDIETQNYSLTTQYDYKSGAQTVSGYNANQQLVVKVRDIQNDSEKVSSVIASASEAGSNQMLGVTFDVSNVNDLKQQARVLAIADARKKSQALATAAGVKLGKVVGWYENVLNSPDLNPATASLGLGGPVTTDKAAVAATPTPEVPSGTQDIIIEISLNYNVK